MDRRRPDLLAWQVGSETLLFDPAAKRAHWLNPTAAYIWSRLDRSAAKIAEDVSVDYALIDDAALAAVQWTERGFGSLNLLGEAQEASVTAPTANAGPQFEPVPPNT